MPKVCVTLTPIPFCPLPDFVVMTTAPFKPREGKNNQPIYVVDGIILDNSIRNGDADWDSNNYDYGNELKNLNPDDFETVSVLKGAAATALYGSRGLNGAVVITTKSGNYR